MKPLWGRGTTRGGRCALALLIAIALLTMSIAACGEDAETVNGSSSVVVQEEGSIEPGDTRDPNHSDLPYDAYTFKADLRDVVVVEVKAEGFVPLLKLVEVATGAPLAEWEEQYSEDDALTYTIAGPGEYEARVYALEQGSGTYTVTVRLNP